MTTALIDPAAAHSAVVGGSSAARVLACPGSIPLAARLPSRSSEYAEEGTALHEAMVHILHRDLEAKDVLGRTFNGTVMTDELVAECLAPCVEVFNYVVGHREFEVEVTAEFPGIDGAFGTADVAYYDDNGELHGIIDWKFGAGVAVEAEGNAQLMFYLTAMKACEPHHRVLYGTIAQPRQEYVETISFDVDDLDAFATELLVAVRTQVGLHEGAHCRWCPAKAICPLKDAHLVTLSQLENVALDLPRLLVLADRAEAAITDIRALALEALEHGQKVPGWKLVAKRATRHWAKADARVVAALNKLTGRRLKMRKTEILSPAQAEKLIRPHKLPENLVTSASSGNTMVPDEDPRPAVMSAVNLRRIAEMQSR